MIVHPIPHTARYVQTENIFISTFNAPTFNKYDFGIDANQNQECLLLQKNTIYLLERISIGGNIAEELYNDAIDVTPLLFFKTGQSKNVKYQEPFKISGYYKNTDISNFMWSENSEDFLTLSLSGILDQTVDLVGKLNIKLTVSLSFFAVDNNEYNKQMRSGITPEFSKRLNS